MRFPEDFIEREHHIIGTKKWVVLIGHQVVISVFGGRFGIMGDGIKTFELHDSRFASTGYFGYLTVDEINEHLINNPLPLELKDKIKTTL